MKAVLLVFIVSFILVFIVSVIGVVLEDGWDAGKEIFHKLYIFWDEYVLPVILLIIFFPSIVFFTVYENIRKKRD